MIRYRLLMVSFLIMVLSVSAASASSLNPAPAGRDKHASGATLAVTRAGGASLYDDGGKLLLDLPGGVAFKVSGRTADNRWFYGSTKDGATGWMAADSLVIFGVKNVPERGGFTEPAHAGAPTAGSTAADRAGASPARAVSPDPVLTASPAADAPAAVHVPAVVKSGAKRLNVRSGPGTTYPIAATVVDGAALTAVGRNATADWIRVELPSSTSGARSGWVSARYLALDGTATDLPVASSVPTTASTATSATGLTGKLVFQESSGGRIAVYDLAGGSLRTLTTGADPAISPDGRTVAFWRESGGAHNLYLIDSDGGNERLILTRGEALRAPAWSPDGSKIVFSHVTGERRCRAVGWGICMPDTFPYSLMFPLEMMNAWGLARVDRDGGRYLDLAAAVNAISPDWSEQGIFYSGSGIQVTQDVSDDSQNRVVLGEYRYRDPAGQPGGDRVVFHSLEKEHWEIFSAHLDGSGLTALTRPATALVDVLPHNVAPAWSPDGQHIVFLSNRNGKWQLWVMDADGGHQRSLPLDAAIEYNYQAEQVVSWGR